MDAFISVDYLAMAFIYKFCSERQPAALPLGKFIGVLGDHLSEFYTYRIDK